MTRTRSEIDEIFAAPPKKKIKTTPPTKSQHPAAETILDPSKKQPGQQRRREKKHAKADNDGFKDSRGSAPRRKTVDGYAIYKEDELGISTTGGGDHLIQPLLALF
ncbi:hypothetical protein EV363DRAFT_1444542 [Boletus edulis]|nr:hypothetical protein EV363DRAFT_1444542 [Boletus edulis]